MKRGVELAKKKAIEFKLTPAKEHSVMQGEEKLTILVFGRA